MSDRSSHYGAIAETNGDRRLPLATTEAINLTTVKRDPSFVDSLIPAGELLNRCIQCGTCSASCPSAHAMDLTPRQMWRLAQLMLLLLLIQERKLPSL